MTPTGMSKNKTIFLRRKISLNNILELIPPYMQKYKYPITYNITKYVNLFLLFYFL
mgnify:CR=1